MKRSRIIFFSIFAGYHVILFFFTLYIRSKKQDPFDLLPMLKYTHLFVYGAILGMILLGIDIIWTWRTHKSNLEEEEALHQENNTLKAKIYDLQEDSKGAPRVVPPAVK